MPRDVSAWPFKPGFGRQYRLLSAAQYGAVFAARRSLRGKLFVLHYRPADALHGGLPRIGLVIPKKQARSAVLRNAIKRQVREVFRHTREQLPAVDLVLRLANPVVAHDKAQRAAWRDEIAALFARIATP